MKKIALILALPALAACSASEHAPLIFGQATTLGVSVGAAATGATPEFTLGLKDANIAIIPTIVRQPDGKFEQIGGNNASSGDPVAVSDGGEDSAAPTSSGLTEDAYSTFGQFEATTEGSKVGLGKFFATGVAAQRLSEGFACGVSHGTEKRCNGGSKYTTWTD
ncbi:MAG TPA: hypothetical protein VLA52_01690 [Thermohalobaculum sp.]|nr:hypothetical protein [Thermohalobaculum sp.]